MMDHSLSTDIQNQPARSETINAGRAFWVAIVFSLVGITSFGVGVFLTLTYHHWQIYAMLCVATLAAFFDILALVLLRRSRVETAVKILYWSSLFTIPLNGLLFRGVSSFLAPMVLFVGFVVIYLLFPRPWRRFAPIGPIAAAAVMLLFDTLNPPFRYNFETLPTSGYFGPLMLGVLIIGILVLIIRQRFVLVGFLSNISVAWKIILMAAVLFLGMLGITAAAYQGVQSLRYQFSNIYDFMLIPITSIDEADTSLTEAQYYIVQLLRQDNKIDSRTSNIDRLLSDNQAAQDVIARYDKEWVTTTSPQFTQALRSAGKIELQQQEVAALAALHAAMTDYQTALNPYLDSVRAGRPDSAQADAVAQKLVGARTQLGQLIDVNNKFADFSNAQAQAAFAQALLSGGIALGISVLLGLFISFLITTSINGRLGDLTRSAAAMQAGNLEQTITVAGRDEVSLLGVTFNKMATQMREFIGTLEQRVAARTKDLATVAEVSTATATILKADRLLQEVVDLSKERFGLYHSHIYLLDEAGENLVLAAGAGEPGRRMMAEGHSIPLNREQSLVARAARDRKGVTVNDVTQAPDFLPNPLLPATRSEMAVPMIVGGNVIGVFDVQSDQVGRFTDTDINIQTTLAAQVATSVQNVNSFERTQARAELETLVNAIGQKIQRTTTVEDALQTAIREIGVALGARRVKVDLAAHADGDSSSLNR